MPNAIAYLALAIWPVVTIVMFRRWPIERALIWSLLGAYLFLPPPPAAFDFPLMPPLTKESLPSLATFVICLYVCGKRGPLMPQTWIGWLLAMAFIFSPVATVLTNTEPVFWGRIGIKALGLKDMVALTLLQAILLLPFLMARQILGTARGQRELLLALFVGGMIYSVPMLLEVRLSPQLNIWIYGYFQHSFEQMVRSGGFRPIVFLYHGLWVAFFAMTTAMAALALSRGEDMRHRMVYLLSALYLLVVLFLCKSLGSLIYAVMLAPMILFLPMRMQLTIAMVISGIAMAYPILKGAGYIPVQWMLEQAASVDPERAASLKFRFDNEDLLIERAYEKPWFGWGSWGRNHILNPISGAIESVTDGRWIILIGTFGWVGYLAEFGLIFYAALLIVWEARRADADRLSPHLGALTLLLSINALDMLPNATLTPITWLIAGALVGYGEELRGVRTRAPGFVPLGWRSVM